MAEAQTPNLVLVGELESVDFPLVAYCGLLHVTMRATYRVLRVEEGAFSESRITVGVSCPLANWSPDRISRLSLAVGPPSAWTTLRMPVADAYLVEQGEEAGVVSYPSLLGRSPSEIEQDFTFTGSSDGWHHYGPMLSIRYRPVALSRRRGGERAVTVKLTRPAGLPNEYLWWWLGLSEEITSNPTSSMRRDAVGVTAVLSGDTVTLGVSSASSD